jgi:hypothetical protein
MFTISMPEEPPAKPKAKPVKVPARPAMLGNPVPASAGGTGEVRQSYLEKTNVNKFKETTAKLLEDFYPQLVEVRNEFGEDGVIDARLAVEKNVIPQMERVVEGWLDIDGVSTNASRVAEDVIEKFILLELKDILLSDNDGIDFSDSIVYDNILNAVSQSLADNFDEIVTASIETLGE